MGVMHYLISDIPDLLVSAWIIPYALLFIGIAVYFMRFIHHLPGRTRRLFMISCAVYVFGALGFELFESHFYMNYEEDHLYIWLIHTGQELLEIFGIIIFIYALLDYLSFYYKQMLLTIGSK